MDMSNKTATALSLCFALSACVGDSHPEKKISLVNLTTIDSLENCKSAQLNRQDPLYETRLRAVLNNTEVSTLDLIRFNKITICIDDRLSKQNHYPRGAPSSRYIDGIFYNSNRPAISLWDNAMIGRSGILIDSKAPVILNEFASSIKSGDIPGKETHAFAASYKTAKFSSVQRWEKYSDFDSNSINRNKGLLISPVKPE